MSQHLKHLPSPIFLLLLLALLAPPAADAVRRSPKARAKERKQGGRPKLTEEQLWAQEDAAMPDYNGALDAEDRGDLGGAEAAYRAALALAPAWVAPAMNRAVLLNRLRRPKEAVAQYEALLQVHAGHVQARFNLANTHRGMGELKTAEAIYRQVIVEAWGAAGQEEGKSAESNVLSSASTNLGNVLQQQGRYEEAVGQHRIAFNLSPETPDAPFNLGISLIAMGGGGLEEAPTLWGAAVQHNPHFIRRLTNAGRWAGEMLEEEAGAVRAVAEQSGEEAGDGEAGAARRAELPRLVASLRMAESNVVKIVQRFKAIFWLDAEATKKRPIEEIDERSMAYGSSPFQAWHTVATHPTLLGALRTAAANAAPLANYEAAATDVGTEALPGSGSTGLVVLGSSLGWFPLLAYLQVYFVL